MKNDWQRLNERQRRYLLAVYVCDHELQQQGRDSEPINSDEAEWRWLPYTSAPHGDSPLKRRIRRLQLLDAKSRATFHALAQRELIVCRYELVAYGDTVLHVRLTSKGRKLAEPHAAAAQDAERATAFDPRA